jgi:hypothetical protein
VEGGVTLSAVIRLLAPGRPFLKILKSSNLKLKNQRNTIMYLMLYSNHV